jgi:hypothetical protein
VAAVTTEPDLPELRGEGREVIDAALHLVEEELRIAERLERKAREQWQLVAFVTPLATGAALTAVAAKGVGGAWPIAIGVASIITLVLLVASMVFASKMSEAQEVEALNPDRLARYIADLHERRSTDPAFDQVRADLATSLVQVVRSRSCSNDQRRTVLGKATCAARFAFGASVSTLALAAIAVMVNA